MVAGRNGAGKSNLLEAIYFACTGRSCRTSNERECVRFGAGVLRLELSTGEHDGGTSCRLQPGAAKRFTVDGAPVERLGDAAARPLVSVFLPDRLELIAGTPSLRRAHLDQVVAALWPARSGTRRAYSAALAQRNALVAAIRAGRAGRGSLAAWDAELARHGVALMADRAATIDRLRPRYAEHAEGLGLEGDARAGLPAALAGRHRGGAGGRAGRARGGRPAARLHRPRPAPRRPRLQARRPRPARLRVARAAAAGAAVAAAGRARGAGRGARRGAADAARRPDVRARRRPPRAPGRGPAARRPERHRGDGARPGARRRRGGRGPRGDRRRRGAADRAASEEAA